MIVHHLANSHSHVILWLLEELGLDYEIVHHQRDPLSGRSPASLAAIHPAAKAPTIEDCGQVMIESTGIILYILDAYGAGRLRPTAGTADAMRFFQTITFIEGSAKAPLMGLLRMQGLCVDDPQRRAGQAYAEHHIGLLDRIVAEGSGTVIPGLFTAADMQLAFFEELIEAILPIGRWPALEGHLAGCRAMASYQQAEAKGGPVGIGSLFERIAETMKAAAVRQS